MNTKRYFTAIFCLFVCTFSAPLAMAKSRLMVRQVVTKTLMEQFSGFNIGDVTFGSGGDFTIELDGLSYEFTDVRRGGATVDIFDSHGLVETVVFDMSSSHSNQMSFNAQSFDADNNSTDINGSFVGSGNEGYIAFGSINGDSATMDYGGCADSSNDDFVIVTIDNEDRHPVVVAAGVILVVVLFVGTTCFIFGWWGCD